jgi:N-formylglutamate amidohydrolase
MHRSQVWKADHEALLDAKLGGLKAGLKLTPDQEKLWGPFEAAVRNAAQMSMQHMQAMMERMHKMRNGMDDQDMTDRPDMMEMDDRPITQRRTATALVDGCVRHSQIGRPKLWTWRRN